MAALIEDYVSHDEVQINEERDQKLKSNKYYATAISIFNSRKIPSHDQMNSSLVNLIFLLMATFPQDPTGTRHFMVSEKESKCQCLNQSKNEEVYQSQGEYLTEQKMMNF